MIRNILEMCWFSLFFCFIRCFERDSLTPILFRSSTFFVYLALLCMCVCGPYSDCWREIFLTVFLVQRGDVCWGFMKHSFKIWLGVCISIW